MRSAKGNTSRSRCWSFTLNNPTDEEIGTLEERLEAQNAKGWRIQEEKEKTYHLQGAIQFKNPRRFSQLTKDWNGRVHWEKAKDWRKLRKYCCDPSKRMKQGKVWAKGSGPPVLKPDILEQEVELKPFQKEIVELTNKEPDKRTIHWYWDSQGGTGKSTLARDLAMMKKALYVSGKASDIKYAVAEYVEEEGDPQMVIVDVPRSSEGYVSYQALECLKNGIFFSGKYESKQVIFNRPHVVVFANFPPDRQKMSADRWHVVNIGHE